LNRADTSLIARRGRELSDGHDRDPAVHAESEQVGIPGDKDIGRSGDGDSEDLIVIRIPADARNLKRRNHLRERLELGSHSRGAIARPANGIHEHGLEFTEYRGTNDHLVIATENIVEETSRTSAKMQRRHERIGVENDPHSAGRHAAGVAAARFLGGNDAG
jgi:hypothetical protein